MQRFVSGVLHLTSATLFPRQRVLHASQKLHKARCESQIQQALENPLRASQYTTLPVIFYTCVDRLREQLEHAQSARQFHELCRPLSIQCPDSHQPEEAHKRLFLFRAFVFFFFFVKQNRIAIRVRFPRHKIKILELHTDAATQSGVRPYLSALSTSASRSISSATTSLRFNCFLTISCHCKTSRTITTQNKRFTYQYLLSQQNKVVSGHCRRLYQR